MKLRILIAKKQSAARQEADTTKSQITTVLYITPTGQRGAGGARLAESVRRANLTPTAYAPHRLNYTTNPSLPKSNIKLLIPPRRANPRSKQHTREAKRSLVRRGHQGTNTKATQDKPNKHKRVVVFLLLGLSQISSPSSRRGDRFPASERTGKKIPKSAARREAGGDVVVVGEVEPDRGGDGGPVPAQQVRPAVPQALPRQCHRYYTCLFVFLCLCRRAIIPIRSCS